MEHPLAFSYAFLPLSHARYLLAARVNRPLLSPTTAPLPSTLASSSSPSYEQPQSRTRKAHRLWSQTRSNLPTAEKERPGSSDHEPAELTSLSYSVAVTLVTGPSPALRHAAIHNLVSQATRPVTVVTCSSPSSISPKQPLASGRPGPPENEVDNDSVQIAKESPDGSEHEGQGASLETQLPNVEAQTTSLEHAQSPLDVGSDDPIQQRVFATSDSAGNDLDSAAQSLGAETLNSPGTVNPLIRWSYVASSERLLEEVMRVSIARDCDIIIVECPAAESPRELAVKFHRSGNSSLRVDAILCVVDGTTLLSIFRAQPVDTPDTLQTSSFSGSVADKTVHGFALAENASQVPPPIPALNSIGHALQDMLADTQSSNCTADVSKDNSDESEAMRVATCIENANIIAVTGNRDFDFVLQILTALNLGAKVMQFADSSVPLPLPQVVNTNLYNPETVTLNATWRRVLLASRGDDPKVLKALPKSAKDVSFVYQARRPFHPTRFYDSIKDMATFTGVLRSTGRIWLPTRMQAPLEWEQAGSWATIRAGSPFWAAIPEADWKVTDEQRDRILKNWDTQYGDRATELIFIGVGFDKDRLQGLLDSCLLQDEEMVFTNLWENFSDPFVQWVPLDEEFEDDDHTVEEPLDSRLHANEAEAVTAIADDEAYDFSLPENVKDGILNSVDLPDELISKASALDILGSTAHDWDNGLVSQDLELSEYDEDDVIIASWEGNVADGILQQIPKVGLPVTVVTGFLGSGKTSLLNYILTADHGLRIAVLVNEFGEVDIDSQLIEKGDWSDADEIMELSNGCICCSINDSFINAVRRVIERKDSVDYLIIETSGVADPVPIINSLMVSDIADDVRLDGILTVVDTENFNRETHMDSEAALSQILAADTVLLSKTDVASPEAIERTIEYIKEVRPAARILKSHRGRVPINMILDVGLRISDSPAYLKPVQSKHGLSTADIQSLGDIPASDENTEAEQDYHRGHGHHHEDAHDHAADASCDPECSDPSHNHGLHKNGASSHLEADGFVSLSFKSDRAMLPELFMERFLCKLPEGVFRAKGLIHFYGYDQRYVFNLSGRRYQFEEDAWPEGVAPSNQIVIIGRNLDLTSLRSALEECQVQNSFAADSATMRSSAESEH